MSYTASQIKKLKSLAHDLKPIVWVGQRGISETLLDSIIEGLRVHELIKVKFHDIEDIDTSLEEIVTKTESTHVQTMGKIVTLFKRNSEKPKIMFD